MLLVVLEEDLTLGKFARKVIREDIDIDLELLRYRIFQVLVQLSVAVKETELVGASWLRPSFRFLSRSSLGRISASLRSGCHGLCNRR